MRLTVLSNLIVSIIFLPFVFGDINKSWDCIATTEGDLEGSKNNIGIGLIISADCTSNSGEKLVVTDDSMLGVNYKLSINFQNGDVFQGQNRDGSLFGTTTVSKDSDDVRALITGPVKNLIFDGIGEIVYKNGSTYKGNIYFGEPNGMGKVLFENGESYEGEFESGKFLGGEFNFKDGSKQKCKTVDSQNACYGQTEIIFPDGEKYIGNYINKKFNGFGRYEYKRGAAYEGIFLDGKKHGYGTYYYESANTVYSRFEGTYSNDLLVEGRLFNKENDLVYVGEFKGVSFHGFGTQFFDDGFYVGEHEDNVANGFGKYVHNSGWSYEGYFQGFEWNGPGTLTLSEEKYIGNFVNGLLVGEGTYIDKSIKYEGNFKDTKFHGSGKLTFLDTGESLIAEFEDGQYIGLSEKIPSKNFKRVALVIGNDLYETGPLDNAVKDSMGIKLALEKSGFRVIHAKDLSQQAFLKTLEEFENILGASGPTTEALFYYAGHAVQVDGINYLNPIDAKINTKYDLEIRSVNLSRIFSILDNTISGIKIVILDACRNNPFNSFVRSPQLGLAQMNAPTGTYISYSTSPGSVALDGTTDGYGYFTGSLVNAINTPGLTIEEVFKKTRLSVISLTNGRQTPWEASSLLGDFYFQKEN